MDPVLLVQALGLVLGIPITLWITLRHWSRQRLLVWQEAATSCGFHVVEMGPPLRARAGPVEVRIDAVKGKIQEIQITVVVPGLPDFDKVRIHPAATAHPPPYPLVPEFETGDARFDRKLSLEGPARLVLALLDAPTRDLLLSLNAEDRLEISHGEIRVARHSLMLSHVLPDLLEVGRRFAQPRNVLQRLVKNVHSDPEPGVRLQNLLLLVHELPGKPVTVKALRTACSDPSPEVRLRAAQELGAEGRDALLEFAENREDDALSAGAVSILDRELPVERLVAILDHALDRCRILTARACVEVLGHVGSAADVLPLEEVAERFYDLILRRAARQAIAEIQSRLPGASPGQLSLALSEAGKLSLALSEAGGLTLATDLPAGHLSLPPEEPERSPASGEEED